jgi:pSer/pThr/pTyr-binding forkhead associated (FHA) protein
VDEVVVGRAATPVEKPSDSVVDYYVADTSFLTPNEVSKVHCKIVRTPGAAGMEYSLYDLQSRCGTYLNGKAICQGDEGIVLSQGDVISLGASHVSTYVFHRRQSGKNHV